MLHVRISATAFIKDIDLLHRIYGLGQAVVSPHCGHSWVVDQANVLNLALWVCINFVLLKNLPAGMQAAAASCVSTDFKEVSMLYSEGGEEYLHYCKVFKGIFHTGVTLYKGDNVLFGERHVEKK